jgi:hypothetical protein
LTSCRITTVRTTAIAIAAGGAGGDEEHGSIRRHNIKKKALYEVLGPVDLFCLVISSV